MYNEDNEDYEVMIQQAANSDSDGVEQCFHNIIMNKVADRIEDIKILVADKMFGDKE